MQVFDWLNDLGVASAQETIEIVEVMFKAGRRNFFKAGSNQHIETGDYVVVEADRGVDFGTVHMTGELVRLRLKSKGLSDADDFPRVIRMASLKDIQTWEAIRDKEAETFHISRRAIDRLALPMKLVDVEWQFDGNKVTFYFTADNRVDFRQLVRDLASEFRTRVELRQIGARDEAARTGGIGSCGRELCCSTWLQEFKPVSTQAARVQNLPLNPVKLSGQCGRLKCCLNYELEQYMDALKDFPSVDTVVRTQRGQGVVQKVDIFKSLVWVEYNSDTWESHTLEEIRRFVGPQRRGYFEKRKARPVREIDPDQSLPSPQIDKSREASRKRKGRRRD